MSRYLVTSALPYANGPIHFGHIAGAYLPADVYVRTLRMQGEEVAFICGTDDYGIAITVAAEKAGSDYASYVRHWNERIHRTFEQLDIRFDIFSGTSRCAYHVERSQEFFRDLDDNGYLECRESEQFYCPNDQLFLADRYLSGTCYNCGYEKARGDECPSCGAWLDPQRLGSPVCRICGTAPVLRATRHWYLDLPKIRDEFLQDWTGAQQWKPNVGAFVNNMLAEVPKRAITRDLNWGVPIPDDRAAGESGKVLYVWFDAPIGYISFTQEYFASLGNPDGWRDYWLSDDTQLVHFIGKDNIPFHCIVFPGMLYGTRRSWTLPTSVPANEFYRLEEEKFSTSEGHTFDTDAFFRDYDRDVTRFYILSTLPETADSDFRIEQLIEVNNSILADTIGNLATRILRFASREYDKKLPRMHPNHAEELDGLLFQECGELGDPATHIRHYRFRSAVQQLVSNARAANEFLAKTAPWQLLRSDPEKAASVLATGCELLGYLAHWMAPMMPTKAQALWEMLGQDGRVCDQPWPTVPKPGNWRFIAAERPIPDIQPLFVKISAD